MPLFMILGGATLFLLGGLMLPFLTVAFELQLNEDGAFEVPGFHQIEVTERQLLALYDMTAVRPEDKVSWNIHQLRATLELVHLETGATYPLVGTVSEEWGAKLNLGEFGFFEISRPGEYLLVVPEEVIPVTDRPVHYAMTLRPPMNERAEKVGFTYLAMALVGAFLFLWGIYRMIRPASPSHA